MQRVCIRGFRTHSIMLLGQRTQDTACGSGCVSLTFSISLMAWYFPVELRWNRNLCRLHHQQKFIMQHHPSKLYSDLSSASVLGMDDPSLTPALPVPSPPSLGGSSSPSSRRVWNSDTN